MSKGNVQDFYPLSPMQQGMLFHTLYSPESGVYCEQLSCTLEGELNISAFQRAWQQILDRHSCLRTAFVWEGIKEPVQVVQRQVLLPWQQLDWRYLAVTAQQQQLEEFSQAEREKGFELRKAPLMRLALIQLTNDTYEFIWTHHHLLLDGWSTAIVLGEVLAIYAAYCRGENLSLPCPRPYRDYIVWLQQQQRSQAESFWRQQLQGFTAPTQLRVNKSPNSAATLTDSYQVDHINLSVTTTAAVQSLVRQYQVTLNTLVQGAWALLLSRYSGETDVVFGTTVSGRPPELTAAESMVGLFINTLPVRVKISEQDVLVNWLQQLQVQQVELRQYEYSQLAEIQQWSEVPPGTSLFETLLVFENYPIDPALRQRQSNLGISNVRSVERTNYPLTLIAFLDSELSFKIAFDSTHFESDTITRLLGHLKTLLEGFVANPQQHLQELPLLTTAEKNQLLVEWTNTNQNYPQDRCIHQLFEHQVEKTPDAIAVVFEDQKLTYRELNQKANQLANYLQKLGVQSEDLVAICVERNLEMVIGLLGILKAGAAYVPLDPAYPQERLAFIWEDTQATVLLTQQQFVEKLEVNAARVICLDTDWHLIATENQDNCTSDVNSNNLAYIIYTSGSTGKPKGVAIEHHNTVTLLHWAQSVFTSAELTGVLASTSICFDLSVFELFVPLSWGGTVILAENALHLPSLASAEQVTLINTVPSAIAQLLRTNSIPASVRTINLAGEALPPQLVQQLYQLPTIERVFNLYGPSEDTTYSTSSLVARDAQSVTIGRPIANKQVYILDSQQQLVPVGVPGELHIGGDGLARGYLNRPELTAEKFIDNQLQSRLYKTGDLARYLPDGNIEYIGRLDYQVKIRGFRIELGEIEAVLSQHPIVREVVVLIREDQPGNQCLVAYIVPQPQTSINQVEIATNFRTHLKEKLPEYMLPSAFVLLEAFPLTVNGKLDRRSLPAPAQIKSDLEPVTNSFTPIEELLAGIWIQVLGVKQVNIDDNFFELGGHSLLATQVIYRIRQTFKIELPLSSLFSAPTIALLSQEVERKQRQEQQLQIPPILPSTRTGKDNYLPLSFAQQRLWFFNQLEPNSSTYNLAAAIRITGEFNVSAIESSFNEIIRRHQVLQTRFLEVDGQPFQVIDSLENRQLLVIDFPLVAHSREQLEKFLLEESQRPFDLAQGQLLRVSLLKLSEIESVMLCVMHHIIADGWSLGVLFQELATLYEAFSSGKTAKLPPLSIQYADFAAWQHQWLQGEVLETQLAYWRRQLGGNLPILNLPTDFPRPAVQTYQGGKQSFLLSQSLTTALKKLSQEKGVTLFMTLLTAFQTLLYRYTQQEDILVGTPIANRNHSEIEGLIGCFANTLVLRTNLSGNPTFIELLGRVREIALAAYSHQDLPFEKLVEALQPNRDLSHNPLFQVLFALHNEPIPALELSGVTLNLEEIDHQTARFDLALDLWESTEGLTGILEYNKDLFDVSTMQRLVGHLQTLLGSIVTNPQQSITTLPLLTPSEQQQLLVDWNNNKSNYQQQCLHELVVEQAALNPNAIAVVFADQQLTYQELNQQANQLAHYLQKLGVGTEQRVGICVERSLEMVVGMLGILKAGAAYVPLDPSYNSERLQFMLADAQVQVLLTEKKLGNAFLDFLPFQIDDYQIAVYLDADWEIITQESIENPVSDVAPDNLAYMIYTSGSTGKPKGVQVNHGSVAHLFAVTRPIFNFDGNDVWTVFHSYSFDFSVWEIWGALVHGSKLVIVPKAVTQSATEFYELLCEQQVTILNQTPSAIRQLIPVQAESAQTGKNWSLRLIVCGGEALPHELANQLLAGNVPLWNFYGPTEATVWTAIEQIKSTDATEKAIAIGCPLPNTQLYILDSYLQLVPIGVPGELHIGGINLARGYWNRHKLTAEKFIPNPFITTSANNNLYKTGDLARYLPNGKIELLGRIDYQVKLRGFRIELGEVETVLSQYPGVRETIVIVREDQPGEKRLVAYFVAHKPDLETKALRRFLQEKLPDYMIPSAFVQLEAMPLNANLKVDRHALPLPEQIKQATKAELLLPRTPTEEIIKDIWIQVLGINDFSIDDNFFDLGGHSLLATQVIARMRTAFPIELPLIRLFESPTVAGIAEIIQAETKAKQGFEVPPIQRIERNDQLPVSFAQQRLWFLSQLVKDSSLYNISSVVRLKGSLNIVALENSLNHLIQRHEALRTMFIEVNGQPVQVIAPTLKLSVPIIDLSGLDSVERETQVHRLITEYTLQPFDLTQCPLLRFTLLKLSVQEYIAILTIHHIISDAWSTGIFLEELAELYAALSTGKASPLPKLTIQYPDFAVWQRQWLQGDILQTQLDYWKQQLGQTSFPLEFPNHRSLSTVPSYQGANLSFVLPKDLKAAIAQLSRQSGVTLFMTLLAAYQTLLYCYTGQEDIRIGSPIANRSQVELEKLIGFFINTLVLRGDLSGNPSFKELLVRSRQVALGAYAHQDLPFEKLVEELQPERKLGHTSLYHAWFVLQNAPMPPLELPGLTMSLVDIDSSTVRHDLLLNIWENAEGLNCTFEYKTDLFDKATILRLSKAFETLLQQVVSNPNIKLNELSTLLSETDKQQRLMQEAEVQAAGIQKLKTIKRKAIIN